MDIFAECPQLLRPSRSIDIFRFVSRTKRTLTRVPRFHSPLCMDMCAHVLIAPLLTLQTEQQHRQICAYSMSYGISGTERRDRDYYNRETMRKLKFKFAAAIFLSLTLIAPISCFGTRRRSQGHFLSPVRHTKLPAFFGSIRLTDGNRYESFAAKCPRNAD